MGIFVVGFLTVSRLGMTVGRNSIFKYPMASSGTRPPGTVQERKGTCCRTVECCSHYMQFLFKISMNFLHLTGSSYFNVYLYL